MNDSIRDLIDHMKAANIGLAGIAVNSEYLQTLHADGQRHNEMIITNEMRGAGIAQYLDLPIVLDESVDSFRFLTEYELIAYSEQH